MEKKSLGGRGFFQRPTAQPRAHPLNFLLGGRLIYKFFFTKNTCFLLKL
jgi:hypothetical protein